MDNIETRLNKGSDYVVSVTHRFEGKFSHFETDGDTKIAVFEQEGWGKIGRPERKVPVNNIRNLLTKRDE